MKSIKEMRKIGLARALSKLGFCSRSQAAKLIRNGHVCLNGTQLRDIETPVRLGHDRIEVNGNNIAAESGVYLMLNKPRGLVTTTSDEKGRQTVYSLLSDTLPWVAPVGRLDKASEGLLLLTNDSEWAARLCDPNSHLDKTYHVHVGSLVNQTLADNLVRGVSVNRELLRAKRARLLRTGEKNTWMEIVLDEGKNRQIRRMFEQFEIEVLRLIRIAIGPQTLGQLPKGKYRNLTAAEKGAIDCTLKISRSETAMIEKRRAGKWVDES
ncbi:MAG TPA: pseudouridine synthase [Candidatus Acidoferrales bacterium]